ncbi:MAG: hypothetical protein EPO06_00260 [Burkholderiaceae bacterium]|nr:MAG: hypothetical protein EPO06_00260 [Burkholderiaceae bacterium]
MRHIYDFSGIEFTPETEEALANWLSESQKENRYGGHRYALEDFGISKQEIDARMRFVRERYAIPYEG